MFSFFAFLGIVTLFAMLADTRSRLRRAELTLQEAARRIGVLQRQVGLSEPEAPAPQPQSQSQSPAYTQPLPMGTALRRGPPTTIAQPPAAPPPAAPRIEDAIPQPVEVMPTLPETPLATPTSPLPANNRPEHNRAAGFEELFGRKLPIWAGGITLAIAGVLIVKYAIHMGLFGRIFTHGVQVFCGLLFGALLIAGAELAWRNEARVRDIRVPQALSGAGVATLYASVLVASNGYHMIAALTAFVALAAITASALGLSLRFGAPSAVLGLAGGLAAPALVGSANPNVPMLAVYLGLTIVGLTGVARKQRWPWLAAAALVGGAGWSLGMILFSAASDMLDTFSVGALVMLLALALPALGLDGPRNALTRSAAAVVGALELAFLVAHGGFAPLGWGLFALLALAGQWLAWRDNAFAIVPSISLALSVALIGIWPHPALFWLVMIGVSLAVIHTLPLLARLWHGPANLQRAAELSALALAVPALAQWHFWHITDMALAWIALGGAALPAIGIATGWRVEVRREDARFALLTTATGVLLSAAIVLVLPAWQAPLGLGLIAGLALFFGKAAGDSRIESIAMAFVGTALLVLLTAPPAPAELAHLLTGAGPDDASHAVIRWGGLSLLFILFAAQTRAREGAGMAQVAAAVLAYGTCSQVVLGGYLPLVPALGGASLLLLSRRLTWPRVCYAASAFAGLSLGWAFLPLVQWTNAAMLSLIGVPMALDAEVLGIASVTKRLLLPMLLLGGALWSARGLTDPVRRAGLTAAALIAGICTHVLYRIAFAHGLPGDFAHTGLAERLLWEGALLTGAWLALRFSLRSLALGLAVAATLHAVWYTLLLHNPLWTAQAVGVIPLANLLIPTFGMVPLGLMLLVRLHPDHPPLAERAGQALAMLLTAGFAWASLRHGFHGNWLSEPGVFADENILRSLLILGLAIGYLLWGIRSCQHDWRIASLLLMLGAVGKVFLFDASGLQGLLRIGSFVALGFSLIGIGWLYSRQLAQGADQELDG